MGLSLFGTIRNVFREKRDQVTKKLSDPVRDGGFVIQDAKKQINEWTTQVAKLRASTIMQEQEHKDALAEKAKYTGIAQKAGAAGNEADVTMAVEAIRKWTTRAKDLKTQIDKNASVQERLRKDLDAARTKVSRAEQSHQARISRSKGAEIRKSLAMASQKLADGQGGLAALDEFEDSVREDEAEAQALEEMAAPVEDDLADKYSGSGSGSAGDDEMVAKFMAKSGK